MTDTPRSLVEGINEVLASDDLQVTSLQLSSDANVLPAAQLTYRVFDIEKVLDLPQEVADQIYWQVTGALSTFMDRARAWQEAK